MFGSIKNLIEKRLGKLIVLDDLSLTGAYFIKVAPEHLQAAVFFLKNDPDTRLTLLDQIIIIPAGLIGWAKTQDNIAIWEIMYQLKSLKLPYRVSLIVDAPPPHEALPSIFPLFLGARWQEMDIKDAYGIEFESNERDIP